MCIRDSPISLVGAFFVMYLAGFTINILTLLAIVLAIGLVVDDAIVVMENIYTKIEQGMSPLEAGFKGSNEIFFAVIATTIALVAVFFPIVFLQGTTGRLFREFSIDVYKRQAQDHCRIMFYNVEHLFDTADDPSTADDEFTPRGKKHWTKAKYTDKLLKIAEVIDSVGDKELPCIVGLAEVENRWVLEDLTQKTALADGNYGIVHQEDVYKRQGPDRLVHRFRAGLRHCV